MGVEELRASLEEEGRGRIAALEAEAAGEAERLRAEAEAATARRRAERLGRAEQELRGEARARIAAAVREERRRTLEARAELLERVFERAAELLAGALAAPGAAAWLEARAAEALSLLPAGPARVSASPGVAPALEALLADRADVGVETDPELAAGFRVGSGEGGVSVDVTAPSLIDQARATQAAEIVRGLAQESEASA